MIIDGKVDLGFIRNPTSYKLDMFQFHPEPLHIILSAEHPLAALPQLTPEDIDNEKFILLDDGYSREILSFFSSEHITPRITQVVKGNLALLGFVSHNLGISMVPAAMTKMLPPNIIAKPIVPTLYRSISIACKDYSKLSLLNKLFYDEIVAIGQKGYSDALSQC